MVEKKCSIISVDRAKTIFACYGGQPSAWPEPEKQALQNVLTGSKVLRALQLEALAVDNFIGLTRQNEIAPTMSLSDKQRAIQIMDNLPDQKQSVIPTKTNKLKLAFSQPLFLVASLLLLVFSLSTHYPLINNKNLETMSLSELMVVYVNDDVIEDESIELPGELEVLAFMEPQILEDFR